MKRFVITIAGETGSGEDTIGKMLADSLKVPFYDRQRLEKAAEVNKLEENFFRSSEEASGFREMLFAARRVYKGERLPPDSDDYIASAGLYRFQADVLREIASKHNCVIRGRCGNCLLENESYLMRVYIHAPFNRRVERMAGVMPGVSRADVVDYIFHEDKRREGFFMYHTGRTRQDIGLYDLSLDSARMGDRECVEYIKELLPRFSSEELQ